MFSRQRAPTRFSLPFVSGCLFSGLPAFQNGGYLSKGPTQVCTCLVTLSPTLAIQLSAMVMTALREFTRSPPSRPKGGRKSAKDKVQPGSEDGRGWGGAVGTEPGVIDGKAPP